MNLGACEEPALAPTSKPATAGKPAKNVAQEMKHFHVIELWVRNGKVPRKVAKTLRTATAGKTMLRVRRLFAPLRLCVTITYANINSSTRHTKVVADQAEDSAAMADATLGRRARQAMQPKCDMRKSLTEGPYWDIIGPPGLSRAIHNFLTNRLRWESARWCDGV